MADYYDQYQQLNPQEKSYLFRHPQHASIIKESRRKAYSETTKVIGYNGKNDNSDAFRHCFWSAILSRDIGYYNALMFTNAHESDPSNPKKEKAMDLHNNSVGLQIGRNGGTDHLLSALCYTALQQGKLKITP
jgi:hypothetical protein